VDRSVDYSVDATAPYYVTTGGTLIVTQSLGGRWDAVGRFGRTVLSYRSLVDPGQGASTAGRSDRQFIRGAGVGYRIGADIRIGVDVDYERRLSPLAVRQYDRFRAGGTFTYAY
jgi:hypothetical protein